MRNIYSKAFCIIIITLVAARVGYAQNTSQLKIDPLMLVSLKECRNIMQNIGNDLYPDWDFQSTPILFYKPNVQELLINFPFKPKGFYEYTGFNPLGNETIYVRNDTTFISYDDQNTTYDIESIKVLVVADPHSRMRNQLKGTFLNQPKDFVNNWLDQWNFIQSPYSQIRLILHEAFHVYQKRMASGKNANEMIVSQYPLLDPVNNSLYVLEGQIIRDALFSEGKKECLEKIKQFAAVRTYRQSLLDSIFVEYENLNEFVEGTAKYVEYKFLEIGERIKPIDEMYYHHGFYGYHKVLSNQFRNKINDMVNIVAVNDNRFGNKFGSGPLRFKLYDLGACQALLLDKVAPEWKKKIFNPGIYLCDLLKDAVKLSTQEKKRYLKRAKTEYNYEQVFQDKLKFEQEGKSVISDKVNSILNTDNTLVTISYNNYEIAGMSYTPFGVIQVDKSTSIYDMVPIQIFFDNGAKLISKRVIPILIDKKEKNVIFVINTPISSIKSGSVNKLDIDEFALSAVEMEVKKRQNHIKIQLK